MLEQSAGAPDGCENCALGCNTQSIYKLLTIVIDFKVCK
jgi:hypothetical protein